MTSLALLSCNQLSNRERVNIFPQYYFNDGYLDERIQEINSTINCCEDNYEAFFWITDMHWEPNLNTRHSPALIKYIADRTGISRILNGGDTGNSQVICSDAINQLRVAIGSDMVYSVNGNHEINDASRYEKPFERVHKILRGHCDDIIYGDVNKSYFYFENKLAKIRYVGLSSFGLFLNNNYESAYDNEQLNWLRDVALNVRHGWTIIVFTHCLYSFSTSSNVLFANPVGADSLIEVINNYSGAGEIACVLMGHTHKDRIHIGPTGVPYIISACDRYQPYQSDINVHREVGAISEQHLEVIIVDKKAKQVYLYVIGANARDGYDNEIGEEVDLRCVTYR